MKLSKSSSRYFDDSMWQQFTCSALTNQFSISLVSLCTSEKSGKAC